VRVLTPSVLSPEDLYDLFLMGLMWHRNEREDILARSSLSVFSPLAKAGAITESQRAQLPKNAKLLALALKNCEIIKANKYPGKGDIVARIDNSSAHFITLVVPAEMLNYTKFFGPRGYLHIITAAGIKKVLNVASGYSDSIDKPRFLAGWARHKQTMRATASRGAVLGIEALYSEGDFE